MRMNILTIGGGYSSEFRERRQGTVLILSPMISVKGGLRRKTEVIRHG